MKTKIIQKLKEIEKEHQVEVLFAVESGSRAWGFESPDSDYDIRFVYKHKTDWYLNLWNQKDTIEFMTEGDLDGSGWDVKKAMLLLGKTNASFLGWIFSPVVYFADDVFLQELKELAMANFNPVAAFYHFHSMNKGFEEVLKSNDVNVKRFFYLFRTALCANWILKKKTVPSVLFTDLYPLIEEEYRELLDELILIKSEAKERALVTVDPQLLVLVKQIIKENEVGKHGLSKRNVDYDTFNTLFLKTVK